MSAPQNPFSESFPPAGPQLDLAPSPPPPVPPIENPPWSGWDVLALAFIAFLAVIAGIFVTAYVAHVRFSASRPWMDSLNRPEVVVAGQLLAYLFILMLMYQLVSNHSNNGVFEPIRWNWPASWTLYLGAGIALAIVLVPLGNVLPMPKNVPLDEFFRTARDAYILSLFGILFAPIFEELFFRGFLYPVVESWLQSVFHSLRRIAWGRNFFFFLAVWGYAVQRMPARLQLYLVRGLAGAILILLLVGVIDQEIRILNRLIVPATCFVFWSVVGHLLRGHALFEATLVPLLLSSALTIVLWRRPSPRELSGLAVITAIGITALAFASIHASQLKYSWGPVLIIFLVGITLTTVRALKKSVAATVLMHMAYNGTIFVTTYIATDGFRHMEKFNQ